MEVLDPENPHRILPTAKASTRHVQLFLHLRELGHGQLDDLFILGLRLQVVLRNRVLLQFVCVLYGSDFLHLDLQSKASPGCATTSLRKVPRSPPSVPFTLTATALVSLFAGAPTASARAVICFLSFGGLQSVPLSSLRSLSYSSSCRRSCSWLASIFSLYLPIFLHHFRALASLTSPPPTPGSPPRLRRWLFL